MLCVFVYVEMEGFDVCGVVVDVRVVGRKEFSVMEVSLVVKDGCVVDGYFYGNSFNVELFFGWYFLYV